RLPSDEEVFPEPRPGDPLLVGTNLNGARVNHFFPWMITPDGEDGETLNHIGPHELHHFKEAAFDDDPNVVALNGTGRTNPNPVENMFAIRENPLVPGEYWGVDAPEFGTHAAGMVFKLAAPPGRSADAIVVEYVTHPDTQDPSNSPSANHSGLYRRALPLSDGRVLVVHTPETRADQNAGTRARPRSLYDFRLALLVPDGTGHYQAGPRLTPGIERDVSWFDPDVEVTYEGELWEL